MNCKLILIQKEKSKKLNISLIESVENSLFQNNKNCGVVYSNMEYSAKLEFDKDIENVRVYVNDELRKSSYNNGNIYFNDDKFLKNRIFINYFGYVSITICIETKEQNYEFYSNYIDVAVRDDMSSDVIRNMIEYISKNEHKYLFENDNKIKDFADISKNKNKDIYTELSMLENIIFEYENNFKYFKTSAKYKINNNYIIDNFEKLKEIKNETIQYIVSNPQQLRMVNYNTGINYNKLNLIPQKTLINKKELTYNIDENKAILGFLKYIYNIITDKIKDVEQYENKSQNCNIESEYISLCNEIYSTMCKTLNKYKTKLNDIKKKIQELYFMYKQILKCEEININYTPKPSYIFLEVQHYRRIYKVIKDWFDGGNYDLKKEKMILTFSEASQIYEYYLLCRINNYIMNRGYSLNGNYKKYEYKVFSKNTSANTKFENTFLFEKNNKKITLYYQPVIHCNPIYENNNIGLFRNNDISFEGKTSQYYMPDYIIKITENKKSEYIILDAKWSNLFTSKKYRFKEIIYKYIFSIDTIDSNDIVSKIWIINGQEYKGQKEYLYNFYNSKFKKRNEELKPSAKILTLNPNIDETLQRECLDQLFFDI